MKNIRTLLKDAFIATAVALAIPACDQSTRSLQSPLTLSTADSVSISEDSVDIITENFIKPSSRVFDVTADTTWDDSLRKYFSHKQVIRIKQAKAEFENVTIAKDLALFYHFTIPEICEIFAKQVGSPEELTMGDDSPTAKWDWFTDYFPVIFGEVLCLDCVYSPMIDIGPLVRLAAKTPEREDDLFFDLATGAYGGSRYAYGNPFFRARGWFRSNECDVCEASLLGDGRRTTLLEKLKKADSARFLFGPEITRMSEQILSVYSHNYFYPKEKVLAEVEKIMNSPLLSSIEKSHVRKQIPKIEAKSEFNCSSEKSCRWY